MKLNEYINEKLKLSNHQKYINDYEENILNYKEFLNYIKILPSSNYYLSQIKNSIEYKINDYENNYYKKLDKGEIESDDILDQICIDLNNDNFDKVKHNGNDIKELFYSNANDLGVYLYTFWGPDDFCKFIIISDIVDKTSEVFEILRLIKK